ncbi:hypothetical protein VTK56DRAFT_5354 [Thermocarpiscus australiensis]
MTTSTAPERAPAPTAASSGQDVGHPEHSSAETSNSAVATSSESFSLIDHPTITPRHDSAVFISPALPATGTSNCELHDQPNGDPSCPQPARDISCAPPPPEHPSETSDAVTACTGPAPRDVRHRDPTTNSPLVQVTLLGDSGESQEAQDSQASRHGIAAVQVGDATVNLKDAQLHTPREPHKAAVADRLASSAKQADNKGATVPGGALKAQQPDFCSFPPPDMGEQNREFNREFLGPPINPARGLDMQFIERYLDYYSEEAMVFAETIEENREHFDDCLDVVKSQKIILAKLKQEHWAEQCRPGVSPHVRDQKLAQIAAVEKHVATSLALDIRRLKEILASGADMVAKAFAWDFDVARATEEAQTTKREKYTEPCDNDDEYQKKLTADDLVTVIPAWFAILDSKGSVELSATSAVDRFKELLESIGTLVNAAKDEQEAASRGEKKPFTKQYHAPNPDWPNPKWQKQGGWWTCRSGREASEAERRCGLCHGSDTPSHRKRYPLMIEGKPVSATEMLKELMGGIEKAMAAAHKRERAALRARMGNERSEHEELVEWHREQQQWHRRQIQLRGGGAFYRDELLTGRNLGPEAQDLGLDQAGPSQSRSERKGKGKLLTWLP